ncbi:MAG: tRNA preQ1(34) S-adenosylmethionine ribosyltransferase-isomerase QueA [Kofleriaceae bacterium]|nr:tRNA preQ1(34) S-adenosylmethionine ribosyltransferase-isomerase QueA [Kofleriaceae bacterium]
MRLTADYNFDLPEHAIAQVPAEQRDASRLLHLQRDGLVDRDFRDFAAHLPNDAILVVNDTRVIRARLHTTKPSGGAVELLVLQPTADSQVWRCLAKSSKALRKDTILTLAGSEPATKIELKVASDRDSDGSILIAFPSEVFELLESHGELPLPPYIARPEGDSPEDRERYQTLFAKESGAVAAPTAGLHFTEEVLQSLDARGIIRASVTLHVGLGTFAPVRVDSLDDIELHEERYSIPKETAELIASGRPIVAVGTTVVRALESASLGWKQVKVGPGRTSIFISPGYKFQVVDHLLTNFHLPSSTLLMLVCAFAGYEPIMSAYKHAVDAGYRFYSYGDAMLLSCQR